MQQQAADNEQVAEAVTKADFEALARFRFAPHPGDARAVRVELTSRGESALARLSALHRDELPRIGMVLTLPGWSDPADGQS